MGTAVAFVVAAEAASVVVTVAVVIAAVAVAAAIVAGLWGAKNCIFRCDICLQSDKGGGVYHQPHSHPPASFLHPALSHPLPFLG